MSFSASREDIPVPAADTAMDAAYSASPDGRSARPHAAGVSGTADYHDEWAACTDVAGETCYKSACGHSQPCSGTGEDFLLPENLQSGQSDCVFHRQRPSRGEVCERIGALPIRNAEGNVVRFLDRLEQTPGLLGLARAQGLVGRSPAFRHMLDMISRVAPSDAAVLLQGESGTGKELAAKAIHDASHRADAPFVVLDCSGLPEALFESELFGHEKGAFTGATARKTGLVEAAAGGTLFLDEVGDIPLPMQVKLLRLLETATYRRVGGTELHRVSFRLVSATHRPLRKMTEDGGFRQDLYFRLNIFPICLPPLRERREDIPLLAEALLQRVAAGRNLRIPAATMALLAGYRYPGNVRELRNLLERASLLCDSGELLPEHFAAEVQENGAEAPPAVIPPDPVTWDEMQLQLLRATVAAHKGTRGELARKLGMSVRTLYRRLSEANAAIKT